MCKCCDETEVNVFNIEKMLVEMHRDIVNLTETVELLKEQIEEESRIRNSEELWDTDRNNTLV